MKIYILRHEKRYPSTDFDTNLNEDGKKDAEFLKYKGLVDLIFAGFPCQGFSNAGKKLPDDPRPVFDGISVNVVISILFSINSFF